VQLQRDGVSGSAVTSGTAEERHESNVGNQPRYDSQKNIVMFCLALLRTLYVNNQSPLADESLVACEGRNNIDSKPVSIEP